MCAYSRNLSRGQRANGELSLETCRDAVSDAAEGTPPLGNELVLVLAAASRTAAQFDEAVDLVRRRRAAAEQLAAIPIVGATNRVG